MTPQKTINLLRTLFVATTACLGAMIGAERYGNYFAGFSVGTIFGLILVLIDRLLHGLTLRAFSSATFGLLLGLAFATLIRESNVFSHQPEEMQWMIGLSAYAAFGYLGMMLAIRANRDEFSLLIPYVRFTRQATQEAPVIVDTNIIIDGRIAEICATGFLSGELIVPRFIMDELQRLSDSGDNVRRERGRRGLDNLDKMQRNPAMTISFHESAPDPSVPADVRLVNLARLLQSRIVSNDANLGRAARLQGVTVLNVNDLAKALRASLGTGDEVELHLSKEGRDAHQAVGYLPDGTMIVVNNGREFIGQTLPVTVSGTVLTSAGRLIFADVKNGRAPQVLRRSRFAILGGAPTFGAMSSKIIGPVAALLLCSALSAAPAPEPTLSVPENLVLDGVPAVPASIAQSAAPYTEARPATLASWHPTRREVLISTRFGNTNQAHVVKISGRRAHADHVFRRTGQQRLV